MVAVKGGPTHPTIPCTPFSTLPSTPDLLSPTLPSTLHLLPVTPSPPLHLHFLLSPGLSSSPPSPSLQLSALSRPGTLPNLHSLSSHVLSLYSQHVREIDVTIVALLSCMAPFRPSCSVGLEKGRVFVCVGGCSRVWEGAGASGRGS
ncbi:hypothetical protein E2C01_082293 [Portunus trituberculatus]|uniref:Uncharacterized protein n=1 Tax=Portunus trituberculatus TaxID=210409 RepID=A0A5B7IPJ1_PORTR|nr:hypothetical protein [Portunus trituberculatus]